MAINNAVEVQPEGVSPMPMFLLTHHFPEKFQGSPETAAAARDWFARLGATVPGGGSTAPAEPRRLGDCPTPGERQLAYTLISTEDLETAAAFAKAWPLLARGGGVQVQEIPVLTPSVQATT
jgi:hypothetical protein